MQGRFYKLKASHENSIRKVWGLNNYRRYFNFFLFPLIVDYGFGRKLIVRLSSRITELLTVITALNVVRSLFTSLLKAVKRRIK